MKASAIRASDGTVMVEATMPVKKALGKMREADAEEALVFIRDRFLGVLSHKVLMRSRLAFDAKVKGFVLLSKPVRPDMELLDVARIMVDSNVRALPVMEGKRLMKIIDVYGVLEQLEADSPVKSLIKDLNSIDESTTLGEALHLMHSRNLKEIAVHDMPGRITGLLRSKRLMQEYYTKVTLERDRGEVPNTPDPTKQVENRDVTDITVANFIDIGVHEIDHERPLTEAIQLMTKERSPIILAKSEGIVQGVLEIGEILKQAVIASQEQDWNIQYIGLDLTRGRERERVMELASQFGERLQNHFNNIYLMTVHIKMHEEDGKKHRYEVRSRISYPGATFASHGQEWSVLSAVRQSFERLDNQLRSKYKDKEVWNGIDYEAA